VRRVKSVNPATEIILYLYSPEPYDDAALYREAARRGVRFPDTLDGWLSVRDPFALRRSVETPWLERRLARRVFDFETVLQARYPSVVNLGAGPAWHAVLAALAAPRWAARVYRSPRLLRLLLRLARYARVEHEGL
jgi:hypothetical protein